jgi:arginyl-tRNA synthetase
MQESKIEETIANLIKVLEKEKVKTKPIRANEDYGDIAIPLFEAQKKGNAEEIVKKITENESIKENLEFKNIQNNFLNLEFTKSFYSKSLTEKNEMTSKSKTVLIEYSSPNIGKPLHFGHIRSTILGESIKRIMSKNGWKAISVNYPGDSGRQVALMMLAMEQLNMEKIEDEKQLLAAYVSINKKVEESSELKEKVNGIIEKIESGDPKTLEKISKIREHSIKIFDKAYKTLNIRFDETKGESQFIEKASQIAKETEKKKISVMEEGALVVKLEEFNLPNVIILRSNKTTVYITRDLAWADYKNEKYHPDLSVYVTDSRQNTHFRQLFQILKMLGRNYINTLRHVSYGFITMEGKAFATREGNTILLEDILEESEKEALKELEKTGKDYSEKEKSEISKKVGIAALKFSVLKVRSEKNISFNPRQSVSFEGDTGAYIQYTHIRSQSILKKIKEEEQIEINLSEDEKKLAGQLSFYPLILKQAERELSPHLIADYALKTAHLFNTFYATSPVIKSKNGFRVLLVKKTEETLRECLEILGIETLNKM